MPIDFSVEAELEGQLEWIRSFVDTEVTPLDLAFCEERFIYDKSHPVHEEEIRPLQDKVRAQNLWACHLGPDLGGKGYGQVKLALMNEILGRSAWAPSIFGCQAPDSGNAEILAHYGTQPQKEQYLEPLLEGRISSCYSMTEPTGGADPQQFVCRATRDGKDWVISGEKWFSSSMRYAEFAIVMAITDGDVPIYQGASMFLVPTSSPGLEIVRHTGMGYEEEGAGNHAYVRYSDVRVPSENLLGGEGNAFAVAQSRLGGGRLHHAMRTVGAISRCLEMMSERAVSRSTQGRQLSKHQMVQDMIAESWLDLLKFRLQVLHAAWTVDQVGGRGAMVEIAGVKIETPRVYKNAVLRAMQIHGALGVSNEMPLARMLLAAVSLGLADGPTEAHKVTVARSVFGKAEAYEGLWPREHLPERAARAREQFAHLLGPAESGRS
ncbi:MAG: acyl-CoA dehydrogenase [bacterium]|nr:acyl-CoA dehydrogenase [bacterium]